MGGGIERESKANRRVHVWGHGNQWLGGQKANAIREANEAGSEPAEPAPMRRQRESSGTGCLLLVLWAANTPVQTQQGYKHRKQYYKR